MTAITDTKLHDKLMKEKKLELKKTIEMIKQNIYERKSRKNTIPEAMISHREKEIKEEPIQRMERSDTRPKTNLPTENRANSVTHQIGTPFTNARHWKNFAITAERKDLSHAYANREKITNANYETSPEKSQRQLEANPTNQRRVYIELRE